MNKKKIVVISIAVYIALAVAMWLSIGQKDDRPIIIIGTGLVMAMLIKDLFFGDKK